MARETVEELYSEDRLSRVLIYHRDDDTFGFEAQRYSTAPEELCWIPVGAYSHCICGSAAAALHEARERVQWLAAET